MRCAVSFGNDRERVFAKAFAGLRGVNRIGGENPRAVKEGFKIRLPVLRAYDAPISPDMPGEAFAHVFW